jgi:hypothetical protein
MITGKKIGRNTRTALNGTLHQIAQLLQFIRQSKRVLDLGIAVRAIVSHFTLSL